MMERKEACLIARETLWVLCKAKAEFPGAYEWFATEMDLSDDALIEAFERLFPGEVPPE